MKIKLDIYETINIYNENGIIFSTVRGAFERATIDGKKCSSHYGNRVFYIDLPVDNIRNALKLNFNKGDVFNIKEYAKDRYEIRNGRALYIPEKYISVENLGEYLALETNGEKDFLTLYRLAFATAQTVSEPKVERIICDNYTLQDGETFGSYYGKDKAHAVITTFDTSESAYHKRKGTPAEKGILKHYFEDVIYNEFIVKSDYYTRAEKDEARTEREKIAEIINSCLYNKTLSHYDIEKIMEKLNITVKEG
jgi:hypothetical protein